MDPISIILLLIGIVGSVVGGFIQSDIAANNRKSVSDTNQANKEMQDSANDTNLTIARETNAMQQMESEKAYQRSQAGNQVALMTQAGMSRAGAINALNGGGSYTPAPINTAQVSSTQFQPYQRDSNESTNLLNSLMGTMSNVGQSEHMSKQLKEQKRSNEINEDILRQQAEANIAYTNAQTADVNAKTIRDDYNFAMQQLNDSMREKATSIAYRVNAADYDTPEAYISALKSKCSDDEQKLFDNPLFVNALNATHQLNQSSSATAATIRNTDASTDNIKEDTKRITRAIAQINADINLTNAQRERIEKETEKLVAEFNEWKSIDGKSARQQETYARQARARLESIAADFDYEIKQEDYEEYVTRDKYRLGAKARGFWQYINDVMGFDYVAKFIPFASPAKK